MAPDSGGSFLQLGGFDKPKPWWKASSGVGSGEANPTLRRTIGWLSLGSRGPTRAG